MNGNYGWAMWATHIGGASLVTFAMGLVVSRWMLRFDWPGDAIYLALPLGLIGWTVACLLLWP